MNISVYITSYNQKNFLQQAIESILAQSLKPFEVLIVDDCSTDGSQELIRAYVNKYDFIRAIYHNKNLGVSHVRVSALSNIKGDYVTYIDGDDIYLNNKLQIESALIDKSFDVSFSNNYYVDEEDINIIKWIWANNIDNLPLPGNMYIETLTRKFPGRNLYRMELINYNLLKKIGFHDTNLKIYEDYDFRIRLSKFAKINYSLIPTSKIRISKNGLSKSSKKIHFDSLIYIFNKHMDDILKLNELQRFNVLNEIENILRPFREVDHNKLKNVNSFLKKFGFRLKSVISKL